MEPPMADITEIRVRIALAELEERRKKERAAKRSARFRFAIKVAWSVGIFALAIFIQSGRLEVTATQVATLILFYSVPAAWAEWRTNEELGKLREEINELRDEIRDKSA
jgi:hypothetical protein